MNMNKNNKSTFEVVRDAIGPAARWEPLTNEQCRAICEAHGWTLEEFDTMLEQRVFGKVTA
jgi:hypothetical protein